MDGEKKTQNFWSNVGMNNMYKASWLKRCMSGLFYNHAQKFFQALEFTYNDIMTVILIIAIIYNVGSQIVYLCIVFV